MDAAEAAIAADRIEPRGLLRLNAPVSFGTRQIAPLLDEFRQASSLRDCRTRSQRPVGRSGRRRLGPRHSNWQLERIEFDRPPDRAMPHGGLRGPGLSQSPRDAAHRVGIAGSQLSRLYAVAPDRGRPLDVRRAGPKSRLRCPETCGPTMATRCSLRRSPVRASFTSRALLSPTICVVVRWWRLRWIIRRCRLAASTPSICRTVIRRRKCGLSSTSSPRILHPNHPGIVLSRPQSGQAVGHERANARLVPSTEWAAMDF